MADTFSEKKTQTTITDEQTFGSIQIKENILDTGDRSINMSNISTISILKSLKKIPATKDAIKKYEEETRNINEEKKEVAKENKRRRSGFSFIALATLFLVVLLSTQFNSMIGFIIFAVIAAFLLLWLSKKHFQDLDAPKELVKPSTTEKPFWVLIISTNDAVQSYFESFNETLLVTVKKVLDDKINTRNVNAVYNINFEKGVIKNIKTGNIEKFNLDNLKSNEVNIKKVETGPVQAENVFSNVDKVQIANKSPGAVIGDGNLAQGNTNHAAYHQPINFSHLQSYTNEWHEYLVQNELANESQIMLLTELQTLMKKGAPAKKEKARLRTIAGDLSTFFQNYEGFSSLLQEITSLAGL